MGALGAVLPACPPLLSLARPPRLLLAAALAWIHYLSVFYYAFEAMITNEMSGQLYSFQVLPRLLFAMPCVVWWPLGVAGPQGVPRTVDASAGARLPGSALGRVSASTPPPPHPAPLPHT